MCPFITLHQHLIPMYGLMIGIGIIIGVTLALILAHVKKVNKEDVIYASMYGFIGLLVGGKIAFLILEAPSLWRQLQSGADFFTLAINNLRGGFVFYGGLAGVLLMVFVYCHIYHVDRNEILSVMVPVIPLIHFFGRIGCLMAGCCYGIPYEGPFAVVFQDAIGGAPSGVSLFPVQILEGILCLILSLWLLFCLLQKHWDGNKLCLFYIMLYAIIRFITEFFRGDRVRGYFLWFSTSQWISILAILGVVILLHFKTCEEKSA